MQYLIDSNIIIYYLNGDEKIYTFLENTIEKSAISIINYYEVLNYQFSPEEEQIVKQFLERFTLLPLSKEIIGQALLNRKIKKIKMADNFILSTAQKFNLKIVTRNTKDFDAFTVDTFNPLV